MADKPKKERKLSRAEVREKVSTLKRSPKAIEMDQRKTAVNVFPANPTASQLATYMRAPNRYDIEGIDAPITAKTRASPKPKAEVKAKKKAKAISEQDQYRDDMNRFHTMMDTAAFDDSRYHEDMTDYLADNRHDEVAKSSFWKRSKKHAAKAYEKSMMDSQKMFATDEEYRRMAAYNKKPSKIPSKINFNGIGDVKITSHKCKDDNVIRHDGSFKYKNCKVVLRVDVFRSDYTSIMMNVSDVFKAFELSSVEGEAAEKSISEEVNRVWLSLRKQIDSKVNMKKKKA